MEHENDAPYRHERLAQGALNAPGTVHMHFDVGMHRDVQRRLCEKLVQFGATPKESFIAEPNPACLVSFPVGIKDEVAIHGLIGLRLGDDLDIEPFSAQLERVVAYMARNGPVQIAEAAGLSAWMPVAAGYTASYPGTIEVHHSIRFPKKGSAPPISLQEVTAHSQALNVAGWSIFRKPDAWCFRSSRTMKANGNIGPMLERDAAKLASLFKEIGPGAEIGITVEQVIASWQYPLEPTEENQNRVSVKQAMGTSVRRLPNLSEIVRQCKSAGPAEKMLVRDEPRRSRIIGNIEPFRRIATAQGFDPVVIGIALVPATDEAGVPRFANHFCSQVAAYGESLQEAEGLAEAYRQGLWYLIQSGSGPIVGYHDMYEDVYLWSSVLPGAKSTRKDFRIPQPVIAAGEQVFSVTAPAVKHYKRVEEVIQFLTSAMGRSKNSRLSSAIFMMIPFRTATHAGGEHLRGCLLALLSSADADRDRLKNLALRLRSMLERAPVDMGEAAPLVVESKPVLAPRSAPLRSQQAKDHDKLWTALEGVFQQPPASRLSRMKSEFPEAFALFRKYPQLEKIRSDMEEASKMTAIVEAIWTVMTGTDRSNLYIWRKKAGLPSRRPR